MNKTGLLTSGSADWRERRACSDSARMPQHPGRHALNWGHRIASRRRSSLLLQPLAWAHVTTIMSPRVNTAWLKGKAACSSWLGHVILACAEESDSLLGRRKESQVVEMQSFTNAVLWTPFD